MKSAHRVEKYFGYVKNVYEDKIILNVWKDGSDEKEPFVRSFDAKLMRDNGVTEEMQQVQLEVTWEEGKPKLLVKPIDTKGKVFPIVPGLPYGPFNAEGYCKHCGQKQEGTE